MRSLFLASTSWLENSQGNNKCKNCIKMKNVNVHHKMKNVNVHHYPFLTDICRQWFRIVRHNEFYLFNYQLCRSYYMYICYYLLNSGFLK
jgi:hypothetical protein